MSKVLALLFAGLLLAACGDKVEVPPAHVGKILTKNGYKPESVPPSKFRLDWCMAHCDRLVLAELSDASVEESFRLFMPQDQLNMSFDIRGTLRIRNDEDSINQIYNRVTPSKNESGIFSEGTSRITFAQVYQTYGRQVLRDVIRSALANYSINDVAANRGAVNADIVKAVNTGLKHTPIEVVRIGLADLQFPEVIVKAKEAAKERQVAIERAEAEKQVALVNLEKELEVARAERNIRKERAQAALEENQIIASSVTQDYLQWRTLEVLERIAEGGNAVFVPMTALDSIGLQQRMFQQPK